MITRLLGMQMGRMCGLQRAIALVITALPGVHIGPIRGLSGRLVTNGIIGVLTGTKGRPKIASTGGGMGKLMVRSGMGKLIVLIVRSTHGEFERVKR